VHLSASLLVEARTENTSLGEKYGLYSLCSHVIFTEFARKRIHLPFRNSSQLTELTLMNNAETGHALLLK